jgi:hypothetical protein
MSTKVCLHLAACAVAAALATPAHAATNLLTNGSFEDASAGNTAPGATQTFTQYVGTTNMDGWLVVGDSVAWIGGAQFGLSASDGGKFLDLTDYAVGAPYGGVQQSFVSTPGQSYTLTFDLGSSAQWGPTSALTAMVAVVAGTASQTFSSTNVTGNNVWQSYSLTFTALNPTTTITLQGAAGDYYIGLDNVSVVATAPVPEPGTWALLAAGLAAVGSVAARRKHLRR